MSVGSGNVRSIVRDTDELERLVTAAAEGRTRTIVGITGAPGSGKSTTAALLVARLGGSAALLPMDGFHLANAQLERLGRRERKGAPDTFDAAGFTALLSRVRSAAADGPHPHTVFAPEFAREIEESVSAAIAIPPESRIVVVEGNYLLLPTDGWHAVADLLDLSLFVSVDGAERMQRLVARHEHYGRTHAEAVAWAGGTDERNAVLIEATRPRAHHILELG